MERKNEFSTLLQLLLAEFWERVPSVFVRRSVHIPSIEGKIDVFVGMRRTGKTYLVYQCIRSLLEQGVDRSAILFLNFEDDRLPPLDRAALASLLEAFYRMHPENHDRTCHLFLDEIQNVDGWPSVIRRFLDTRKVRITLTGSSAKLLSKEIATSLRGRSIATEVWPLDFDEYCQAVGSPAETRPASPRRKDRAHADLLAYLRTGGLPEVARLGELDRKRVLQDYVSVVILRDMVERHRIKNEPLLRYFVNTLLSQTARPLSLNKLANDLKSQGRSTGKNTLYQYLEHIKDCYLAFDVPIFSESPRKRQSNPRKIYAVDTGLAASQSLGLSSNLGRLFENLVYLDLRRAGFEVSYYLTRTGREVDFVAVRPGEAPVAFQACALLDAPETREREEKALEATKDELGIEGSIVTLESYGDFRRGLSRAGSF